MKLRIYLQDGTLQAGNMVVENPDSFVILTKEGRIELKKDKIMFINGKTLKQWEERPDKLFQTEIIPSEVPDPAYVNDKAPYPSLTPAGTKAALVKPNDQKSLPTAPVEAKAVPLPAPPKMNPVAAVPLVQPVKPLAEVGPVLAEKKQVPAPNPPPVVEVKQTQSPLPINKAPNPTTGVVSSVSSVEVPVVRRHVRRQKKNTPVVDLPVPAPSLPIPQTAEITPPTKFSRKEFGDYHFARAQAFVKRGEKGRAIQELHLATILDRQNGDSVMLLGKLYSEDNQPVRAQKYFAHPLVKKRDEVKSMILGAEKGEKKQQQTQWILYGATALGTLAWIPLLIGWRRIKKPKQRIITASSIEETKLKIEELLQEEKIIEAKVPQIPSPLPPAPSPVLPPPLPTPLPPLLSPVMPIPLLSPVPPEPAFTGFKPPAPPIKPSMPDRSKLEPVIPPPMPPPIVAPPIPPPLPVAELPAEPLVPYTDGLDVESVLRLASMVERAVRKGNSLAMDNQEDLARREYRTALALNPSCMEAYLGLGYLCFSQGQWDLAFEHYLKALSIDPNSADAHYGIGRVLMETEHIDEAVSEFQKTLTLDPAFDDARETLSALGALA